MILNRRHRVIRSSGSGARRTHLPRRRGGFTLVELIATIVVLAAIGSVATGLILTSVDGYIAARTAASLQTESSMAVDRVVRELRNIPRDPSSGGSSGDAVPHIASVTSDSIEWGDSSRLRLDNIQLLLSIDGSEERTLAHDVSSFQLRYFDEDNAELQPPLSGQQCHPIQRIEILLSLSRHGVVQTVRTRVFLRCTVQGI